MSPLPRFHLTLLACCGLATTASAQNSSLLQAPQSAAITIAVSFRSRIKIPAYGRSGKDIRPCGRVWRVRPGRMQCWPRDCQLLSGES